MLDKGNIANKFANHTRLAQDRPLMGEWKCSKCVCCDTWLQFWLRLISLLLYTSNLLGAACSSALAITTSLFCHVTPSVIEYHDTKDFNMEPVNNPQLNNIIVVLYICILIIFMFRFVIFRECRAVGDRWKVSMAGFCGWCLIDILKRDWFIVLNISLCK